MSKAWQSPLPYPGSKREAVYKLAALVPVHRNLVVSPFFGAGSFEFYLLASRRELSIVGSDAFAPLVNFWRCMLERSASVSNLVLSLYKEGIAPELYWEWYQDLQEREARDAVGGVRDAAKLFILSKLAFNKMLPRGLTRVTLEQSFDAWIASETLRVFGRRAFLSRLEITCRDAFDVIAGADGRFLFCDPPYLNDENLYGFGPRWGKDFNHDRLAQALRNHAGGFLLTYNDCPEVRSLYEWARVEELVFPYAAARGTQKTGGTILGREVVIRPAGSLSLEEINRRREPVLRFPEKTDRFL